MSHITTILKMKYSEGERSTRRLIEDDKSRGKTEGMDEYGNGRSAVVLVKRLMNWSLGTTMFRIRCKRTAIMINPKTYQDVRKPHRPGKGVDRGGGGDCDSKNSPDCRSCLPAKANEFSELCIHLSSLPNLCMRPSKRTGKVDSVKDAWITLDFASLNTSPVAFANIVFSSRKRG